ncbi:MAG: sulfite exporter TauE/SafE family protein [Cyclobacteriaceae bacterium]|nr:sulfite exporter TauE/SafE family protein [Cyclobacteriaceae bacterium]
MTVFIWITLAVLLIYFTYVFGKDIFKHQNVLENVSIVKTTAIGFIVNFFDALGIGAFAPQTALLKITKQTEDRVMPGTLNVADTIPVLIQSFVFIQMVEVEPITLLTMLLSATAGAVLGAGIVAKLAVKKIQLTMSFALVVAAFFMLAGQMDWIQGGGEAIGLIGWKLALAIGANFILGALMTVGIGLYAPCMVVIYALGMSPIVAFPIMMGSCAFLMPPAAIKFIKEGAYNRKAAVTMAIPGIIAVLIAAFIVKSLPLDILRWVVIVIIMYTSVLMLRSALNGES